MLRDETPMEPRLGATDGAEATFTAWMTQGLRITGIVGGSVGNGELVGRILDLTPGEVTAIDAVCSLIGTEHAFTALLHVEQWGLLATLTGVVTDGWGKGSPVRGEYTEIPCHPERARVASWRGTLTIGVQPAGDPGQPHGHD